MQGGSAVLARAAGRAVGRMVVVGGLTIAALVAPVSHADAQTAAPPPAFASPFTCGQTWFARTYAGHPSNAVDWNLPGPGEADYGQAVFAGATGIATVATNPGYGLMVTIDHGNGWTTLFAHLSAVALTTGDRVELTTLVGAVGRSGRADGSHLHQEQQLNGVRQPVTVDGHPVNATFSSRGASYTSANCPRPVRAWASWRRWRLGRPVTRPLP